MLQLVVYSKTFIMNLKYGFVLVTTYHIQSMLNILIVIYLQVINIERLILHYFTGLLRFILPTIIED